MKKKRNKNVGKVGWCDGETLGLDVGHYVFIRRVNGKKCDVNTFSSIEKKDGSFQLKKMQMIRSGDLYPIPKKDDTLPRFGGIDSRVIKDVPLSKIQKIGRYSLKRRHHHYIQKYMKKK